jgi:hypothetical protein
VGTCTGVGDLKRKRLCLHQKSNTDTTAMQPVAKSLQRQLFRLLNKLTRSNGVGGLFISFERF